jgi:hypothetical protein
MANRNVNGKDFQVVIIADQDGNAWDPDGSSSAPSQVEYLKVANAGTIPAGAFSVAVINSGTANGTLAGVSFTPDEFPPAFEAAPNSRLGAIAYDATGTEFTFSIIR